MKCGARLFDSPIPSSVPVIDFAGSWAKGLADLSVTDWTTVPADGDPLGNDRLSNCCQAAKFRWAQIKYASRYGRVAPVPAADVIADYARLTGYDPATGLNDRGTDPNEMMSIWAADPNLLVFEGENWPIVWARVRPWGLAEIAAAMRQTPLLMTVWLPLADADRPENWANPPGSEKGWEGTEGHEMLVVRNGADGLWTVRTWGQDYLWHVARNQYVHDLAAPLESSRVDLALLGLDFDEITGAQI